MSEQPINVLIIDDDEDDFVVARDLLEEAGGDAFQLKWVPTYREGVEEIRRGNYDAYLIDFRLGSRSGLDLLRDELDHGRQGPAIILTGQGTHDVDIEAMEAGAAAYLVKGKFSGEELERTIRYAIQRHRTAFQPSPEHHSAVNPRILSFIGAKGGVGTTTVAVNVAVALALESHTVCAVDLRASFGLLARYLDLSPKSDICDLLELAPERIDASAVESRAAHHPSGVRAIPAPSHVARYRDLGNEHTRAILAATQQAFDFTIIDLPIQPSPASRAAVDASDFVAVVLERESGCLASARAQVDLLLDWGSKATVGIVIVDRGSLTAPMPLSEIVSLLGCEVFGVVPHAPDTVAPSIASGIPFVLSTPERDIARSVTGLAERLGASHLQAIPI